MKGTRKDSGAEYDDLDLDSRRCIASCRLCRRTYRAKLYLEQKHRPQACGPESRLEIEESEWGRTTCSATTCKPHVAEAWLALPYR